MEICLLKLLLCIKPQIILSIVLLGALEYTNQLYVRMYVCRQAVQKLYTNTG